MRIASLKIADENAIGIFVGEQVIDYTRALQSYCLVAQKGVTAPIRKLDDLFELGRFEREDFMSVMDLVERHHLQSHFAVGEGYHIQAPIHRPGKIVALGRNYALHAKEGKNPVPGEPIIFAKASSSVIGHGDEILIPKGVGRVEHEIELGVVVGKRAKKIPREEAYDCVAGYTIVLDITEREMQKADIEKKNPWFRSKSFDTFSPMGPWIVTADEIQPPVHLDIELSVNGQIRQKSNTSNMIFDIPTIIEFITQYITLEPGDVIATGTPEGVGPIKDGDTITGKIEKIGELVNTVREI